MSSARRTAVRGPGLVSRWARRSAALVLAGLALASCSLGGAGTRPDPAAPSGPDGVALLPYAQRFAAIVDPIETARSAFESGSGALATGAAVDDFLLVAQPFADRVEAADLELRRVTWPAVALQDVKSALAADMSLRAELLGTLDDTLIAAVWRHQILAAANRAGRVRRRVRIELGLHPPSG